jgi:thiol-disulfide isomerase/thioredoxin
LIMLPLIQVMLLLIGDPAPAVGLTSPDGRTTVNLSTIAPGKIVLIDFFATWCGPCQDSIPVLERLRKRHPEVVFVSVSIDENPSEVPAFVRQMKIGSKVLVDPQKRAYTALGAHMLPTTYILDGKGVVRKINHGFGPGYEARVAKWLDELSHAPPVHTSSIPTTTSSSR